MGYFFPLLNAEVTHLFLCAPQAENDLNELKALMHSPNAIVVRPPHPTARATSRDHSKDYSLTVQI